MIYLIDRSWLCGSAQCEHVHAVGICRRGTSVDNRKLSEGRSVRSEYSFACTTYCQICVCHLLIFRVLTASQLLLHARSHVRTHTHTHACTHACTHARTHARTHRHTPQNNAHMQTYIHTLTPAHAQTEFFQLNLCLLSSFIFIYYCYYYC